MKELGKIDTITKDYMRDPIVFADAFNKFLYHGKQVIHPQNLKEIDTTEIVVPYGADGASVPEQKYRDVLKLAMTDGNTAYCILGCEDQGTIHYAMPVKNMVYDAMQLAHQVTAAAKSRRRMKESEKIENLEHMLAKRYKTTADEFLSGFYKTDRLIPVLTLVIYWGPEKWDGPLSLKQMYAATDEMIMQHLPDYKINLIAPEQLTESELTEFKTSLKEVMLYIKYSNNKKKLQEVTMAEPSFRKLDRQAAEVINVVTNSKLKYPVGKETIDVCAAIEEMRMESELKGKIEGTVKTYKEVGISLQEVIQRISERYSLSLQEAQEKVGKYWE